MSRKPLDHRPPSPPPPPPPSPPFLNRCWTPASGGRGGGGHSEAGYGRPVDRGVWTAKTVKRPWQQPAHPQYANYWAPLTRKRHIPPHSAQPQHTNDWAPRTRKRHQPEHRPQRPTERSDPTQHAKGRAGDCPGPHKETTTRQNVTQGGGGYCSVPPRSRPMQRFCASFQLLDLSYEFLYNKWRGLYGAVLQRLGLWVQRTEVDLFVRCYPTSPCASLKIEPTNSLQSPFRYAAPCVPLPAYTRPLPRTPFSFRRSWGGKGLQWRWSTKPIGRQTNDMITNHQRGVPARVIFASSPRRARDTHPTRTREYGLRHSVAVAEDNGGAGRGNAPKKGWCWRRRNKEKHGWWWRGGRGVELGLRPICVCL